MDELLEELFEPTPKGPVPTFVLSLSSSAMTSPSSSVRRSILKDGRRYRYDDLEPWEEGGNGTLSGKHPDPGRSLRFDSKWRARHVHLSPDCSSASCLHSSYGGFLLSAQHLIKKLDGRWFEVRIDRVDSERWSDGLGIGVAVHPGDHGSVQPDAFGSFEGYAYELFPDSWLLGYDGRAKIHRTSRYFKGQELPRGMWRPSELRRGDVLGLMVTPEGNLMLFVNEELVYYARSCGVPDHGPLYAALDLDGCTQAVHMLDTNGRPSQKVLSTAFAMRKDQKRPRTAFRRFPGE